MSNEDFKRELNGVFDGVTGAPSPHLGDRVRASLAGAPRSREPYWLAGVAAVVMAALIVGVLYVANPFRQSPSPVGGLHSPSASPSVTATPGTSPSATPSQSPLPPFECVSDTVAPSRVRSTPTTTYVTDLKTGSHGGYDRLTITFGSGPLPSPIELRTQSGTKFTLSPSGMPASLRGQNGILVVIQSSDMHTSYSGSTDIVTGYSTLAEVRRIEDFEGVVQLGLGINGPACYRAFYLGDPTRLVIDVQTQ